MSDRQYYVYILANKTNVTLYTGVTNDLKRREAGHKNKATESFTKRYDINKLVYYEAFGDIEYAILREKQLKDGSRAKKKKLVESINPKWQDLCEEICG